MQIELAASLSKRHTNVSELFPSGQLAPKLAEHWTVARPS